MEEIKEHPFFHGVDWDNLRNSPAPYIPVLSSPIDTCHFEEYEEEEEEESNNGDKYHLSSRLTPVDIQFIGYTYKSFDAVKARFETINSNALNAMNL